MYVERSQNVKQSHWLRIRARLPLLPLLETEHQLLYILQLAAKKYIEPRTRFLRKITQSVKSSKLQTTYTNFLTFRLVIYVSNFFRIVEVLVLITPILCGISVFPHFILKDLVFGYFVCHLHSTLYIELT